MVAEPSLLLELETLLGGAAEGAAGGHARAASKDKGNSNVNMRQQCDTSSDLASSKEERERLTKKSQRRR